MMYQSHLLSKEDQPKPVRRRRRQPKLFNPILVEPDFTDYPGLLEWLQNQAKAHARTPAQEIVYLLLQRKDRHER
jgi:hypothetical protein